MGFSGVLRPFHLETAGDRADRDERLTRNTSGTADNSVFHSLRHPLTAPIPIGCRTPFLRLAIIPSSDNRSLNRYELLPRASSGESLDIVV